MLHKNDKIFIAGHKGMVGSAIVRRLQKDGYANIITRTRKELDLLDQRSVFEFFESNKIDSVFLAAAKVGGVHANNTYRADFIYENLTVQNNVIWGAFRAGVKDLLFLGSSCIYPCRAPQPLKEEYLLTGPLEPTNEPYAIAKIAGIKLCESLNRQYGTGYRAVMPTNLYGPNDTYNLENSHVLPALIRKFHLAKLAENGEAEGIAKDEQIYGKIPEDIRASLNAISTQNGRKPIFPSSVVCHLSSEAPPAVILWGSGAPYREFLHVDDMAVACLHVMKMGQADYNHATTGNGVSFLNVGSGADATIADLAGMVNSIVGYGGDVIFDAARPDGMYRKVLDVTRINANGWTASIPLEDGIRATYEAYKSNFIHRITA